MAFSFLEYFFNPEIAKAFFLPGDCVSNLLGFSCGADYANDMQMMSFHHL